MFRQLIVLTVITATLIALHILPGLEAQEQRFYFVGAERVPLQPSPNYRAFKLDAEPADFTAFARNLPNEITAQQPSVLERYNLLLLRRASPMSASSIIRSLNDARSSTERTLGPVAETPVYWAGGVDHVLVNEFIVQFHDDVGQTQSMAVLADVGAEILQPPERIQGRYIVTFPTLEELDALDRSNALHRRGVVEFSQPNFVRVMPARPVPPTQPQSRAATPCPPSSNPNDTFYSCQWALLNDGSVGEPDADIDADDAWRLLADAEASAIIIAVLDDGVDTNQEDLSSKIVTPYDATDRDNDQEPNVDDAHGTACAGIAMAVTNNALGIAGVSAEAQLMPIRIATGGPDGRWITTDLIIDDGLRTAVDRGAHVLSNSWGGGLSSNVVSGAVDYALDGGRVVVFATGNEFLSSVDYPARLSLSRPVIAVGATNEWDELKSPNSQDGEWWWGSNYGDAVTVVAPGVHIYTTDISGTAGYDPTNYYAEFNGTSSATPHVAGIVALMLSVNPELSPSEVKDILQTTAEDLGDPGFDSFFGYGRVNAKRAVAAALARR